MLAFRGQMLAADAEVNQLRERLQAYADTLPTKKLDPTSVVLSKWANRHESSYKKASFLRFKDEIAAAGGNVQAILVRPLSEQPGKYELVFGHRRHRACLETGVPVLAAITVEPLSDKDLFIAMDRENREREDLSPWEQGKMYLNALDAGLFPSRRRLAEEMNVSHTWVNRTLKVAELPEVIVLCFRSPTEIGLPQAEAIAAALEQDRKAVLRRAEKLRQTERMSAAAVALALVGTSRSQRPSAREIKVHNKAAGKVSWDAKGRALIQLQQGVVTDENLDRVIAALETVLADQ